MIKWHLEFEFRSEIVHEYSLVGLFSLNRKKSWKSNGWRLSRLAVFFAYFQGKFIINYLGINFLKHIFGLIHVK